MTMLKGEPHWPLDVLWPDDRVDTMFRHLFRNFFTGEHMLDKPGGGSSGLMKVEELIEDDTCVIRAELPGVDPDKDVDISVADGVLHLRAERKEHTEEKQSHGYRSEFHYGMFDRSIRLPEGTTESDISATYKDGILEVRVPAPKPVESSTKKIQVNRG